MHMYFSAILIVVGTRPEVIKLAPVIRELEVVGSRVAVLSTGQHSSILDDLFAELDVYPWKFFSTMVEGQELSSLFSRCLLAVSSAIDEVKPNVVVVQGDTTTALASAHAAFYKNIPVAHVEAGLRTYMLHSPFPEEFNRQSITVTTCIHFSPTQRSRLHLIAEGVPVNHIWVTGNTIIDQALHFSHHLNKTKTINYLRKFNLTFLMKSTVKKKYFVVLLTCHRRENLQHLKNVEVAIKSLLHKHKKLLILLPLHPNRSLTTVFENVFNKYSRLILLPSLHYGTTIVLMKYFINLIITDSGGLQEEATTFHIPVIVMRDTTERPEGIESGVSVLVGTNATLICEAADMVIQNVNGTRYRMSRVDQWPYGKGHASKHIANVLLRFINGHLNLSCTKKCCKTLVQSKSIV